LHIVAINGIIKLNPNKDYEYFSNSIDEPGMDSGYLAYDLLFLENFENAKKRRTGFFY
jgi:hypothetical protein